MIKLATFEKRETGWRFRVSYKKGNDYKQKSQGGYKSKKEAQLAAAEVERRLSLGTDIYGAEMLFSDYFKEWFEIHKKGKHSISHEKNIIRTINEVEEFFLGVRLKDLNRNMYQSFLNKLAINHAKMTVKKRHNCVKSCIQYAIQDGLIQRDPTFKAVIFGEKESKKEDLKFINQQELTILVEKIKSNMNPKYISRYIILFGIATGARFGEIVGLTWDCVDFENRTIHINKTWDYQHTSDFANTKNYQSVRKISIDTDTVEMLKFLQKHQKQHCLKTGLRNPNKLCFVNNLMEIVSNAAVNNVLRKLCKQCGIKQITCHSLRHTHASVLLYNGVNIKYISRRLGHKDIVITLQTYSHILDEMEQKESALVDQTMQKLLCTNAQTYS